MEFFDKLAKKANEAYKVTADKTSKIAKETKLRMKMEELKNKINKIYGEIGKTVYENHVEQEANFQEKIEEQCTQIDMISDEIKTIESELLELKGKRKCPKCYTELEREAKFCPKCGEKQEEPVEVKEEATEEAKTVEYTVVEETEDSEKEQENKEKSESETENKE